jgi:hypothetical protein
VLRSCLCCCGRARGCLRGIARGGGLFDGRDGLGFWISVCDAMYGRRMLLLTVMRVVRRVGEVGHCLLHKLFRSTHDGRFCRTGILRDRCYRHHARAQGLRTRFKVVGTASRRMHLYINTACFSVTRPGQKDALPPSRRRGTTTLPRVEPLCIIVRGNMPSVWAEICLTKTATGAHALKRQSLEDAQRKN